MKVKKNKIYSSHPQKDSKKGLKIRNNTKTKKTVDPFVSIRFQWASLLRTWRREWDLITKKKVAKLKGPGIIIIFPKRKILCKSVDPHPFIEEEFWGTSRFKKSNQGRLNFYKSHKKAFISRKLSNMKYDQYFLSKSKVNLIC